jgi:ABC-type nitrate/sulfonate/bicarbonate transport system substrate-binding protein
MLTSRRAFLRMATLGGAASVAALFQACAPGAPGGPTAAPPKQAEGPAPASAAGQARTTRTFRIAYLTLGWAGIEAIDALGLLRQRGWNVEWQRVGPISGLVNAFSSGQAEIIDMSAVIVGQMWEQGVKLSVFGAAVGTLGAVVAGRDTDIQAVTELKGRRVAGIPGGTTTQDINASIRKSYGFDVFKDTQFVQATAPPDVANLLVKGDVEAVLIWEPTTTQLIQAGAGRIIATQQQLWEQASGSRETQVHVVYLTTPQIAREHPDLLADINAAQREVAVLWQNKAPQLVDAFATVTQLPKEVIVEALDRTTPLSGLREETIDTILTQLKFNREFGTILQSDIWTDPAKAAQVKQEMFVKVG